MVSERWLLVNMTKGQLITEKKLYNKESRRPVANCWQNKVKTVILPCKFETGFCLHLDRGPLITVWQVWIAPG